MAFVESPRFPDRIARNAQRKRMTSTQIVPLANGFETTNRLWSQKIRQYDIGSAVRRQADYDEILQWFEALDGPADAFRFKDWGDYAVTLANGRLRPLQGGVQVGSGGAGYGVPTLQLVKRYQVGPRFSDRDIRKPVAGTVAVQRNGSPVAVGSGAGQIAIDTTTGVVTFVADQVRGIASHTPGASHQMVLGSALAPNVTVGQRLYVSGVTGTAAAVLNDQSHPVTAVSGANVTLGVSTTGLTATTGNAALYPQATDVLTWAGEFDVPVRFASDEIDDVVLMRTASGEFLAEASSILLREKRV